MCFFKAVQIKAAAVTNDSADQFAFGTAVTAAVAVAVDYYCLC